MIVHVFLVVAIPLLVFLAIAAIILLAKRKWLYSILIISVIIFLLHECCFLPLNCSFKTRNTGNVRLLTYNICSDGEYFEKNRVNPSEFVSFLKSQKCDIIAFQEYNVKKCLSIQQQLMDDYPYFEFNHNLEGSCSDAIYSKYPIDSVFYVRVDTTSLSGRKMLISLTPEELDFFNPNRFILCSIIDINKVKTCIINCHFSSDGYNKLSSDCVFEYCRELFHSINVACINREVEATYVKRIVDSISLPSIVCGDLNDFSRSQCLSILQRDGRLLDSWEEKGFGFGNTYNGNVFMHYRLDHILYTNDINLVKVGVLRQKFSDHDALVADFEIK